MCNIDGNQSLTDLTNLIHLDSVPYLTIEDNPSITSLSGIDNISPSTIIYFTIRNNALLTTCEVQSVCDYISLPNANIGIENNAPGCNSQQEVEEACIVSVPEQETVFQLTIYPNPTVTDVTISGMEGIIEEISIYNKLGQRVIHEIKPNNSIDVSRLPQGLYIVEVVWDGQRVREKLIIQ